MPPCFCSFNPPSISISKFISDQPFLSLLETHCHTITDLKKIHAQIIKSGLAKDTIAASRLVSFSATSPSRDLDYALSIFHQIKKPSLFTWNTIIRGFSQSSNPRIALQLFVEMLISSSPENLTYPSVFKAYTQLGLAKDGAQLHGRIIKLGLEIDPYIRNSIIHMYADCGFLSDAWKLFNEDGKETDVVAWNSMVMGLAKAGEVDSSWRLFCEMPFGFRNEISWNTMISGFVRNGKWGNALDLFDEMQQRKITPSEFTLVSILNACAKLGALEQGKWVHQYIKKNEIDCNTIMITAIIDMYCKCGDIEMGKRVFEGAPRKGLSCWNSMMLGLATNGFKNEAFELFLNLEESSNLRPDSVTFIAVLTACNHALRVDKAREYFKMMEETYRIKPTIKHYGCMVDVLGRAGLIEEAAEVVTSMPMEPDAVIWGSLLSGCASSRRNVEVAEWAAKNLILSGRDETSAHVLLSNVYAASGDFGKAVEMKKKVVEKQRGCSLIEVNGEVHEFLAGGNWHSL